MERRDLLRLTGALFVPTVAGCAAEAGNTGQESQGLIAFDEPEELLLTREFLPGSEWSAAELVDPYGLDAGVGFVREFEGEDGGDSWIVRSSASGRDNEEDAVGLYGELYADWRGRIGDARIMEFDLANEAAVAGYDGVSEVIFRYANCVGSVTFTDCTSADRCFSHVGRAEQLAQRKQESWRSGETEAPETDTPSQGGEEPGEQQGADGDLQFGESFSTPTGLVVTPSDPRLRDSYEYEGVGGDTEVDESGDGTQFAFVDLVVENGTDGVRESPNSLAFEIIAAGTQYEMLGASEYEADDRYRELTDLAPGVAEEGVLPFEIPADMSPGEIGLIYTDSDLDTDAEWSAVWSAG